MSEATQRQLGLADDSAMESTLALGERLLAAVEAFALQCEALGDIELPPAVGAESDQAVLRALAALYFAAELEETRLLSAVETLAGVFVSGGLPGNLGPAAPMLAEFWRKRQERFNEAQRCAIFAHVFGYVNGPSLATPGHGSNAAFETLLFDLAEDLTPENPATPNADLQIRMSARQLAANLIARGGGITVFAAGDLLSAIKTALEILKQPAIQHAVGANSVWLAVRSLAQSYLNEQPEIGAHTVRAKAGMLLLAWLAEALPRLEQTSTPLISASNQVIGAAFSWLQATLDLAEQEPAAHARAA